MAGCQAAGTLHLVIADLPFGMTLAHWDAPIDLVRYFKTALRLLRPDEVLLMCAVEPFSSDVVHTCRNLYRSRWHWWDDGPSDNFLHSAYQPLKLGQDVLMFSAAGRSITFNPQKVPLDKPRRQWRPVSSSSLHRTPNCIRLPAEPTQYESRHPVNFIFFPTTVDDRQMATQKPLAMAKYFVKTYSNPGDWVGDFTFGAGTTAVAAAQCERRFVGSERDRGNYGLAVNRLRRAFARASRHSE